MTPNLLKSFKVYFNLVTGRQFSKLLKLQWSMLSGKVNQRSYPCEKQSTTTIRLMKCNFVLKELLRFLSSIFKSQIVRFMFIISLLHKNCFKLVFYNWWVLLITILVLQHFFVYWSSHWVDWLKGSHATGILLAANKTSRGIYLLQPNFRRPSSCHLTWIVKVTLSGLSVHLILLDGFARNALKTTLFTVSEVLIHFDNLLIL